MLPLDQWNKQKNEFLCWSYSPSSTSSSTSSSASYSFYLWLGWGCLELRTFWTKAQYATTPPVEQAPIHGVFAWSYSPSSSSSFYSSSFLWLGLGCLELWTFCKKAQHATTRPVEQSVISDFFADHILPPPPPPTPLIPHISDWGEAALNSGPSEQKLYLLPLYLWKASSNK